MPLEGAGSLYVALSCSEAAFVTVPETGVRVSRGLTVSIKNVVDRSHIISSAKNRKRMIPAVCSTSLVKIYHQQLQALNCDQVFINGGPEAEQHRLASQR